MSPSDKLSPSARNGLPPVSVNLLVCLQLPKIPGTYIRHLQTVGHLDTDREPISGTWRDTGKLYRVLGGIPGQLEIMLAFGEIIVSNNRCVSQSFLSPTVRLSPSVYSCFSPKWMSSVSLRPKKGKKCSVFLSCRFTRFLIQYHYFWFIMLTPAIKWEWYQMEIP